MYALIRFLKSKGNLPKIPIKILIKNRKSKEEGEKKRYIKKIIEKVIYLLVKKFDFNSKRN